MLKKRKEIIDQCGEKGERLLAERRMHEDVLAERNQLLADRHLLELEAQAPRAPVQVIQDFTQVMPVARIIAEFLVILMRRN